MVVFVTTYMDLHQEPWETKYVLDLQGSSSYCKSTYMYIMMYHKLMLNQR